MGVSQLYSKFSIDNGVIPMHLDLKLGRDDTNGYFPSVYDIIITI